MNKQKKGLVVLAVILFGAMAIGYAALSNSINISGSASAITADFKIEFDTATEVEVQKIGDQTTATATYTDAENATIDVSNLKKVGDAVIATYTVVNHGEVNASVSAEITEEIPLEYQDYYEVTTEVNPEKTTLAPNETTTVDVIITLRKVFTDETEATTPRTFKVTVTGNSIENAD